MSPVAEQERHTHAAKLAALAALAAGQLSTTGRARIERHLASCDVCRSTHQGMRLHHALTRELQQAEPAVDFGKMELALRREARRAVERERAGSRVLPRLAVAAAILLGLVVAQHWYATRSPGPTAQHAKTQQTAGSTRNFTNEGAQLTAEVTALAGHGQVHDAAGTTRDLTPTSVLAEGDRLELAAGSQAHVRVADATGFVVEEGTQLGLSKLRTNGVILDLSGGSVTSQVRHLEVNQRYEVHAGGYRVAVRGTHFRVSFAVAKAQLTAEVSEGHVVVSDASGTVVSDLIAPARFAVNEGQRAAPNLALAAPRLPAQPLTSWPVLRLAAWPEAVAFTVDGGRILGGAGLAMRVPVGDVTLRAELRDGRTRQWTEQVPEAGLSIEHDALDRLLHAPSVSTATASLDASSIRGVVTAGMPELQRCYERSLKQRPDLGGRFGLRIEVTGGGQVRRVTPHPEAEGANLPDDLLRCIRAATLHWHFPAPGGAGVTFDAPIRLTQGK